MSPSAQLLPNEIWLRIVASCSPACQNNLSQVNRAFMDLVKLVWTRNLNKIWCSLDAATADFSLAKKRVLIKSKMTELGWTKKPMTRGHMWMILTWHHESASSFSSDDVVIDGQSLDDLVIRTDLKKCKSLRLAGRCPQPSNRLVSHVAGGSLAALHVDNCKENIEAAHRLMTACPGLSLLKLEACDSLISYSEVLTMKGLSYLEMHYDMYYHDYRDQFINSLNMLPNLKVLKLVLCFGMRDEHVIGILNSCPSLNILHLPFNGKITGWFLEELSPGLAINNNERQQPAKGRNDGLQLNYGLQELQVVINQAYTNNTIPEQLAQCLASQLKEAGLNLRVEFINRKLTGFNPRGFAPSELLHPL